MRSSSKYAAGAIVLSLAFACAGAGAAQVEILAPAQQDTVHDNSGNLTVDVKVDPPIDKRGGKSVRILLDGAPAAPDSVATRFALRGVERGEHWLQALLVDGQGQTLSVSDTIYFTMWQASVNAPPRQKK